MDENQIKELILKYTEGVATSEEIALVETWFNRIAQAAPSKGAVLNYDQLKEEIWSNIKPAPIMRRIFPMYLRYAAAIAIILFGAWFFSAPYLNGRHPDAGKNSTLTTQKEIALGKNTATLTLASGKVIQLSDAKTGVVINNNHLAYNDGSLVGRQINDSAINGRHPELVSGSRTSITTITATTPKGGTYQVILPDGTHVYLNADSKITFPSQFNGKERKILLSGEAYFVVVHNAKQPFKVESNGQVVEDIGTEFNIKAYSDESVTKTTLVEGSASISSLRGAAGNEAILKANEQSVLANNKLIVTAANTEEAIAWKNGYFRFNDQKITDIMLQLSRWYDIEVKYVGTMAEEGLYGKISRYKNISDVLKMLEKTGLLHFKVEGRRVTVSR